MSAITSDYSGFMESMVLKLTDMLRPQKQDGEEQ